MADASFTDISRASRDEDLLDRLISAAAVAGIPQPQVWVQTYARQLAIAPVNEAGDTVASVYAYAVATYSPTPRPGANPATVTDQFLSAAVAHIIQQGA